MVAHAMLNVKSMYKKERSFDVIQSTVKGNLLLLYYSIINNRKLWLGFVYLVSFDETRQMIPGE